MTDARRIFTELLQATESRKVEFKSSQYILDNDRLKSQFVQDILCMANAPGDDGYILLGIQHEKDNPPKVVGISNHHDSATLEQIVNGVIEEPIQFEYHALVYQGKQCGLLHVPKTKARPHWPKRDYGALKKHVFYTRRASGNREASIQEIRDMFLQTIRILDIPKRKAAITAHVVDELANFDLPDRRSTMYKMLRTIAREMSLTGYHLITRNSGDRRELFALICNPISKLISDYVICMYPWDAASKDTANSQYTIARTVEAKSTVKTTPAIRDRLKNSTPIHVSYKKMTIRSLEKSPYFYLSRDFANKWTEAWGTAMKWEVGPVVMGGKVIKMAWKYEFFLPDVASKEALKERLKELFYWVEGNVT